MEKIDDATQVQSSSTEHLRFATWLLGIAFCSVLGWVAYNFLPEWELPEKLKDVTVFSSKELQEELGVAKTDKRFRNSMTKFALLGGCFGLPSVFFLVKRPAMILVCVAIGLASGALAGTIGYYLFVYIERGGSIPGVDFGLTPLVLDIILLTIGSWALAIPVGMVLFFARPKTQTWDPKLLFVAGIVSGVSIPILMSVAFPHIRSDVFPPKGWELTLAWLCVNGALLGALPYLPKRKIKSTAT